MFRECVSRLKTLYTDSCSCSVSKNKCATIYGELDTKCHDI